MNFEDAIYDAFPLHPVPEFAGDCKTAFNREAKRILAGKKWNEVIDRRLISGEMDLYPSVWLTLFPIDIFLYYLPSHLILAALLFSYRAMTPYPAAVIDTLILPPSSDPELLEDIDGEISFGSRLEEDGNLRIALYKKMTRDQRVCVADFLTRYGQFVCVNFTERGIEFYKQNIDYWRNSSLKV